MLFTDVVMPRMNGCQLAQQLQAARPGMKVLYMSGYADSALLPEGILQNGLPILEKPFTSDGLARRVRELLDQDATADPSASAGPAESTPGVASPARFTPLTSGEHAGASGMQAVDQIIPAIVTPS